MVFSECVKLKVKKKAHFRCCLCQSVGFLEVHHLIPQEGGGSDSIENAVPLCEKCHGLYGDSPGKRKWIRQKRDWWYEYCEKELKYEENKERKLKPDYTTKYFALMHRETELVTEGARVNVINPTPEDKNVAKYISHGLGKSGTVKSVADDGSLWVDFDDGTNGIYYPAEVEVIE